MLLHDCSLTVRPKAQRRTRRALGPPDCRVIAVSNAALPQTRRRPKRGGVPIAFLSG